MRSRWRPLIGGYALFGYAFLYMPIVILVVYSFNESRLVTVWGGFSTKWYGELLGNERILQAAWLSVRIAAVSATGAVLLGTAAAIVLVRFGRFRGRGVFNGLLLAPLVMPDVIIGLSLLLLFVWLQSQIGWPAGRSGLTVGIAHITVGVAYTTVMIRARLSQLGRDLDDAAADLGAPPWRGFVEVTLPLLAPALAAGWLLSFTLSLDDLVVASFVSGPGSSTLPIVVFSSVRLGVSPQINALATVMVVVVALIVLLVGLSMRQSSRRPPEGAD
ncbi:MAG: ABC transporter permease subunit [Proteobacteria bacterium]|nr:ABC transporter permease subunit [Pseudomonadota bacterium]MDA1059152.1 ABC transporter permease subunit [Pseudomonadota bacterium]